MTFNPFAPSPACAVDTATGKPATVAPTTPPATYAPAAVSAPMGAPAAGPTLAPTVVPGAAAPVPATLVRLSLIGDGVTAYRKKHNAMPPAYLADKKGKPLLSWRVAILPYLGHERLYKRFHLDEPWDSLHNRELVSLMPEVYQNPGYRAYYTPGKGGEQSSEKPSRTPFLLLRGAKTFYADPTPAMPRMYEGWLKPIVIVVSRCRAVPWTKPEEYVYDAKDPSAGLAQENGEDFILQAGGAPWELFASPVADQKTRDADRRETLLESFTGEERASIAPLLVPSIRSEPTLAPAR